MSYTETLRSLFFKIKKNVIFKLIKKRKENNIPNSWRVSLLGDRYMTTKLIFYHIDTVLLSPFLPTPLPSLLLMLGTEPVWLTTKLCLSLGRVLNVTEKYLSLENNVSPLIFNNRLPFYVSVNGLGDRAAEIIEMSQVSFFRTGCNNF